jgi:hypothetical protein
MRQPEVSSRLRPLIEGGVVATTASLDAEALYSARGPAELLPGLAVPSAVCQCSSLVGKYS